jgi:hypothetical protein
MNALLEEEEITLSAFARDILVCPHFAIVSGSSVMLSALPGAFSYSPITLPAPVGTSGHTLARRALFDVRFQLSLSHAHAQGPLSERDERNVRSISPHTSIKRSSLGPT